MKTTRERLTDARKALVRSEAVYQRVIAARRADVEQLEALVAREKRVTPARIERAREVRDHHGWHEVYWVNAKSVNIKTPYFDGYTWITRVALKDILEVRP